jgi:hypothetical protein
MWKTLIEMVIGALIVIFMVGLFVSCATSFFGTENKDKSAFDNFEMFYSVVNSLTYEDVGFGDVSIELYLPSSGNGYCIAAFGEGFDYNFWYKYPTGGGNYVRDVIFKPSKCKENACVCVYRSLRKQKSNPDSKDAGVMTCRTFEVPVYFSPITDYPCSVGSISSSASHRLFSSLPHFVFCSEDLLSEGDFPLKTIKMSRADCSDVVIVSDEVSMLNRAQ